MEIGDRKVTFGLMSVVCYLFKDQCYPSHGFKRLIGCEFLPVQHLQDKIEEFERHVRKLEKALKNKDIQMQQRTEVFVWCLFVTRL